MASTKNLKSHDNISQEQINSPNANSKQKRKKSDKLDVYQKMWSSFHNRRSSIPSIEMQLLLNETRNRSKRSKNSRNNYSKGNSNENNIDYSNRSITKQYRKNSINLAHNNETEILCDPRITNIHFVRSMIEELKDIPQEESFEEQSDHINQSQIRIQNVIHSEDENWENHMAPIENFEVYEMKCSKSNLNVDKEKSFQSQKNISVNSKVNKKDIQPNSAKNKKYRKLKSNFKNLETENLDLKKEVDFLKYELTKYQKKWDDVKLKIKSKRNDDYICLSGLRKFDSRKKSEPSWNANCSVDSKKSKFSKKSPKRKQLSKLNIKSKRKTMPNTNPFDNYNSGRLETSNESQKRPLREFTKNTSFFDQFRMTAPFHDKKQKKFNQNDKSDPNHNKKICNNNLNVMTVMKEKVSNVTNHQNASYSRSFEKTQNNKSVEKTQNNTQNSFASYTKSNEKTNKKYKAYTKSFKEKHNLSIDNNKTFVNAKINNFANKSSIPENENKSSFSPVNQSFNLKNQTCVTSTKKQANSLYPQQIPICEFSYTTTLCKNTQLVCPKKISVNNEEKDFRHTSKNNNWNRNKLKDIVNSDAIKMKFKCRPESTSLAKQVSNFNSAEQNTYSKMATKKITTSNNTVSNINSSNLTSKNVINSVKESTIHAALNQNNKSNSNVATNPYLQIPGHQHKKSMSKDKRSIRKPRNSDRSNSEDEKQKEVPNYLKSPNTKGINYKGYCFNNQPKYYTKHLINKNSKEKPENVMNSPAKFLEDRKKIENPKNNVKINEVTKKFNASNISNKKNSLNKLMKNLNKNSTIKNKSQIVQNVVVNKNANTEIEKFKDEMCVGAGRTNNRHDSRFFKKLVSHLSTNLSKEKNELGKKKINNQNVTYNYPKTDQIKCNNSMQ